MMTSCRKDDLHGVLLVVVITLFIDYGQCAVKESDLFPYDVKEDRRFRFGDDDFTTHDFKIPFNFFNKTYQSVFISGNGQVSFGEGTAAYTPACSPSSIPMIMAFWGDSNNRLDDQNAKLLFRETTDRIMLRKAATDVFKAFPDLKGINLSWMFIVTWKEMPFYGASTACNGISKRNTFQLVLATDGVHSFALLYYSKIEWTSGTASNGNCHGLGGSAAKAGFDYVDRKTWYTVPGSCGNSIVNITQTSNINEPGKWAFRIDSNLQTAECQEFDNRQTLRLSPSIVSPFGNVPLELVGPCVTPKDTVICIYSGASTETEVEGIVTPDSKAVVCPIPSFDTLGRKSVTLKITHLQKEQPQDESGVNDSKIETYTGYLYVVNGLGDEGAVKVSFNRSSAYNISIDVKWDPTFVEREMELLYGAKKDDQRALRKKRSLTQEEQLNLSVEMYDGRSWRTFGDVKSGIENTGSFQGPIDKQLVDDILGLRRPELLTISLSRSANKGGKDWNKIIANPLKSFVDFHKIALADHHPLAVYASIALTNHLDCKAWSYLSGPPPTDTRTCPPTRAQADIDGNFENEDFLLSFFHPGGHSAVRQKVPSFSGAGSQCVYDENGNIMTRPPAGGTLDRYSPNYSVFLHFVYDVIPYLYCCRLSGVFNSINCENDYYRLRPSNDGTDYPRPRVTRALGDPHITTFDGLTYTFNGVGEFWMVKAMDQDRNLTFKMQARMEQYVSIRGVPMNASVFTAVTMEEVTNGETVIVQVSYTNEKILVSVDGETVDLDDGDLKIPEITFHHKTSQISIATPGTNVRVAFSSGFSFKFSTVGPNEVALNILGMTNDRQMSFVEGLMGNCDGDMENDLKLPNGTILPTNSTSHSIHFNFGLAWMVQESESIFTYLPGKSYLDYCKPNFQPHFISDINATSIPQKIIEICEGHKDCIFDYATTGSEELANGTKVSILEYDHTAKIASKEIKVCSSVSAWDPENGYTTLTNTMIGGNMEFFCDQDYHLEGGSVNCTCISTTVDANPEWVCNKKNPFPITCISNRVPTLCEAPPPLSNGYVVGTNFSIGSTIELRCNNDDYDIFWKNCIFNGEVGICKEFCNVTYTCVHEEITLQDGTTHTQAVWEGFGGNIAKVACYSKLAGRLATLFRATSLMIHASTKLKLVPAAAQKKKPYLIGC